jgi:hypothetical protein
MIHPDFFASFKQDAIKYEHLKSNVKKYIEDRYTTSTKSPVSCYSVRVGFQMIVGNVPHGVVALWCQEWGYKVEPIKGKDTGDHVVFIRLKPLLPETDEKHYKKEWKPKRKDFVVY